MTDAELLILLEAALTTNQIKRREIPFAEQCRDALRAGTLSTADRADVLALIAELDLSQPPDQARGNDFRDATIERVGDPVAGNKYEVHYHGTLVDVTQQVATYRDALRDACCQLPLAEADDFNAEERQIHLDQVYTMLEVASTVTDERASANAFGRESMRQQTVVEAVNQHGRLVLVGEPGSGKSTVVNYLTLVLASAHRPADLATTLPQWNRGAVLPVRVILRQFAAWVSDQPASVADHDLLWVYLATLHSPELVAFLRQRLREGTAMLVLDGYDEVPSNDLGQPLARVRAALIATRHLPLVLITCRVLDYDVESRRLVNWSVERIIPFSSALQTSFIERWYTTLQTLKRAFNGDPVVLKADLQREVHQRPELRRLAGNPLLLTMMAQLHAYKNRLPDERVKLYAECIEFLLYRWRAKHGVTPLPTRLGLPDWSEQNALEVLARIGYAAHQLGMAQDDERGADVPDELVLKTIRQYLHTFGAERSLARATAFLEYIRQHSNGVLQQFSSTTFRFPHRTFQEYLAARRLVSDGDWSEGQDDLSQRLVQIAHDPQWREVLTLAISQLAQTGQSGTAADVLEAMLDADDSPTSRVLVAELYRELVRDLPRLSKHRQQVAHETINVLVEMLNQHDPTISQSLRLRAGDVLGFLGDPRPGVCDLIIQWCDVPAGTYTIGGDMGEDEQTVTLDGFRLSKYCITNAQWKLFMDAGGYHDQQWWGELGWQACRAIEWTQPRFWDDLQFNAPNQPVVGVSWYEAEAFCRWLSSKIGYSVMLPTDAHWEVAARGHDRLIYPWGHEWNADNANTSETNRNRTSGVGCYPQGVSWCGILDMIGNVLEWTASEYNNPDRTNQIDIMNNSTNVSLRGGSWNYGPQFARVAYRGGINPRGRINFLGIRLMCALTS